MNASSEDEDRLGSMRPKLAVVIPMFNEVAGAQRCVVAVSHELADIDPTWPLIVVDDGSADGTLAVLERLAAETPALRVTRNPQNMGYGAALRTGATEASAQGAEWVLFMDSDLTNPPEHIRRFVSAIGDDVDYVKASRYAQEGRVHGVPLKRRLISRAGNLVAAWSFRLPLSDITNGFRAIRTERFLEMPLRETGFPIIAEEAYWAFRFHLRCAEVPTILTSRQATLRSSSFAYRPRVVAAYGRYPIRALGDGVRLLSSRASAYAFRERRDDYRNL